MLIEGNLPVFWAGLYGAYFGNAKGGVDQLPNPPCAVEGGEMASTGEG